MPIERGLSAADLALQTIVGLDVQVLDPLLEQVDTAASTVTADPGQELGEAAALIQKRLPVPMLLSRRSQGLHLPARGDDRLVGSVELVEFADQSIGDLEGRRLVQHELPQECVEIAEILGRLGLVQQPQRHFALDTE